MLMTVAGLRKPLPLNYEGRCKTFHEFSLHFLEYKYF